MIAKLLPSVLICAVVFAACATTRTRRPEPDASDSLRLTPAGRTVLASARRVASMLTSADAEVEALGEVAGAYTDSDNVGEAKALMPELFDAASQITDGD